MTRDEEVSNVSDFVRTGYVELSAAAQTTLGGDVNRRPTPELLANYNTTANVQVLSDPENEDRAGVYLNSWYLGHIEIVVADGGAGEESTRLFAVAVRNQNRAGHKRYYFHTLAEAVSLVIYSRLVGLLD